MFAGMASRLFGVILFMAFGGLSSNSFASDNARTVELSKALAQVKLFAGMTDAERDALKSAAVLRHGKAGERIIEQGKKLDRMFVILNGQAEIRINGKRIVNLSGQSLVGEIEFLDSLPASADVVLLGDADLIELPYAAFSSLMEKQPRLGYVVMREIAKVEGQKIRENNRK
jgi:CRP/FNR family transcriptional regulator, cyclic AMP receptor protein